MIYAISDVVCPFILVISYWHLIPR